MATDPARERDRADEARNADDESVDSFFEIPAAVLCNFCGASDCPGCVVADEHASGVIAIIPWERPGRLWTRLWSTATATTNGAESFFAALPDGEVSPAMRFALLAELLAVASMALLLVPILAIALPGVAAHIIESPALRMTAARWVALGVPLLSVWMMAAHVTHGAALDVGARRQGGRTQRRRAVRYGLYACGWDLMGGPLGAAVAFLGKGKRAVRSVLDAQRSVPGRAAQAFLQGVYGLDERETLRARRVGGLAAVVITLASGFGLVGIIITALVWR
ncbi:MAG TPA: hypothetical protein VGM56_05310 [Byssovorax sp.]|jgi:hypothetical protein